MHMQMRYEGLPSASVPLSRRGELSPAAGRAREKTVAGVRDPNIVDVVGRDPGEGSFVLYMVEDRTWDLGPNQLDELKRKISNYASYILDGGLALAYPETV